ncbi:MAG: hypothetical protein ICV51_09870 [Flavisolibacter sp.]|nr:hypothetical protein [Flavisolibacter sp.]
MFQDIQTAYNAMKETYPEKQVIIPGYSIGTGPILHHNCPWFYFPRSVHIRMLFQLNGLTVSFVYGNPLFVDNSYSCLF